MKQKLVLMFIFCSIYCNAQKICFEYDSAGNQITREICFDSSADRIMNPMVDTESIEEPDLKKFFSEDVISYYPNPVKEELFLKWELADDKNVSKIEIYNLNGQSVKAFSYLEKENSKIIPFLEYPVGIYHIILHYTSGEQKSIRIIKK